MTRMANFRTDDESEKRYLEGYFIRFNEETELWPNYFEKVDPKAIPDDIGKKDIRVLFNHDTAKVLGRTTSNTLTITKDKEGIYGKVLINEDDPEAISIYAKVKRGDVSQASFGFYINDEDTEDDGIGFHSTLLNIDLFEVSVVAFPAYESTEINARSNDLKNIRFKKRKQKMIEELKQRWQ